jgi:hypothetical protein
MMMIKQRAAGRIVLEWNSSFDRAPNKEAGIDRAVIDTWMSDKPPWMSMALWTYLKQEGIDPASIDKNEADKMELHERFRGPAFIDWYDAMDSLQKGDKTPICKMLRSDAELNPNVRGYLADIFERMQLRRPRARPWKPAYRLSKANQSWWLAVHLYKNYIQSGVPKEVALVKAAKEIGRSTVQLKSVLSGKHGSFNRALKRPSRKRP